MHEVGRFNQVYEWCDIPEEVFIYKMAPYLELQILVRLSQRNKNFAPIFMEQALRFPARALRLLVKYPKLYPLFDQILESSNGSSLTKEELEDVYQLAFDDRKYAIIGKITKLYPEFYSKSSRWFITNKSRETAVEALIRQPNCA